MSSYFEVRTPRRAARLRLEGSFVVVGRGEPIPIFHDDPSLSREHAALVVSGGEVRVRDLGSKNRVLLNGQPLERYAEVVVRAGDVLKMGATTLTLRDGEGKSKEKPADAATPKGAKDDDEASLQTALEPPPGEASVDSEGEPISRGVAAQELEPPPSQDEETDDDDDELIRTADPDSDPGATEPQIE